MPSSHLILCRPLFLLPPILPSIRVFSNESTLPMRWPKYWSFSFSISPSKEIPGLISSRMDWLDLLAVQGTLKSLLQHHSSKHQLFSAQLSSQSNSHSPRIKRLNFMAAVTICNDFGAQENSLSLFLLFLHLFAMKWWDWMPWSSFFECWILSQLFHSPLSLSSRGWILQ